jgi:hypothetical protein
MAVYDRTFANVAEVTGDLVAEARAELESEAHEVADETSAAAAAH